MIGHRGAAAVAPENTLEALQAAVAAGADLVEFDVGPGSRARALAERGAREHVTLDEALEFLRAHGVGVHLDVKQPGYEAQVVDAIDAMGSRERRSSRPRSPRRRARSRSLAPEVPRAIGYPRDRYGVSRIRWPGARDPRRGGGACAR